ncbi:MAG: TolC family protein, partial [Anaerolineae bacterium]|nr:TolC family protein [Phycisphaerae bacterium]
DLAQRRLDFANELLLQGRSTDSRDVTDAQSSLLSAQDAYEQARADLQIQILQFMRDTGTLRVDPEAGTLGLVFDRANPSAVNTGTMPR